MQLPYSAFSRAKALPKDKPQRIYGVMGDALLQQKALAALLEWCLPPDARDFNCDILEGEEVRLTDLLGLCQNLPFLADHRVVLVKHAERLEGMQRGEDAPKEKEKGKASPVRRLADGIKQLPDATILILARTPETPEMGSRAAAPRCINATIDKEIDATGLLINCTIGPKDAGLAVSLLQNEARERGIALEPSAAAHLVNRLGHDFAYLANELEKCALRVGPGAPVTAAVIDEMTRRTVQETVFNLTDAIGARRAAHASGLLHELLESGEAPEMVLVMLVRHLRQLLQARTFLDAGLPLDGSLRDRMPPHLLAQLPQDGRDDLTVTLRSQNWLGGRLTQQARNFSLDEIQKALCLALETDLAFKGIEGEGGEPNLLLEKLIAQLC